MVVVARAPRRRGAARGQETLLRVRLFDGVDIVWTIEDSVVEVLAARMRVVNRL